MQFLDKVRVSVKSGKGGDGCVSGRREAGVPYGGPSGGNGGKGGAVILVASKDINTLLEFKYKKHFAAPDGEAGRTKEQYGANAEDLTLKVPVGTLVTEVETGHLLHYFSEDKEKFVVAHGGEGGLGNMEFTTPTLQYPTFAILGEPGSELELDLELQLMGDVALIGSPSVGKSTIINALANTKAKVADYHFTTLIPHLGSVKVNDFAFNLVDIPGLIKGASEGKGLGNEFLRHVLKAKIFNIVMDLYNFDQGIQDGIDLLEELFSFIKNTLHADRDIEITVLTHDQYIILTVMEDDEVIMQKQIMFCFNKFDLIQDEELMQEYISTFFEKIKAFEFDGDHVFAHLDDEIIEKNIFTISAATHHNLPELARFWADHLEHRHLHEYVPTHDDKEIYQEYEDQHECIIQDITDDEKDMLVEEGYLEDFDAQFTRIWYLDNKEVCKLVYTLQWGNDEAEMRFRSRMEQLGYLELIKEAGARKGDVFRVKSYYSGYDDRYIQW